MKVFITGFMGSGKTVLAKELAPLLQVTAIDLDEEIEKLEQTSISEIFKTKGEKYFRKLETDTLKRCIQNKTDFVMSCGGGIILSDDNVQTMKKAGITVYLNTDFKTIHQRLLKQRFQRPLIADTPDNMLFEKLHNIFELRAPLYQQADIITNAQNLKQLAIEIKAMRDWQLHIQ